MHKKEAHLNEVDHGYIRYANVWEDPFLLLEGLSPKRTDKVLSIASAGDNSFALLSAEPNLVVAVDLNKTQLYLTELKSIAIQELEREDYLKFVGFRPSSNRVKVYQAIKNSLSSEARAYWNGKMEELEKGIIYQGKFEKYLATFAKKVLPFIHSKKNIERLFQEKNASDQQIFFDDQWNSFRWKTFFNIFFCKRIMGFFGRDPAFLKQVEKNVSKTIKGSADLHLASIYSQKNPMLYYCLHGDFGDYLPFYAKEENYKTIRSNLGNLKLQLGYAQDATKTYGNFDAFNLSNIFEYMDQKIFADTTHSLKSIANPGARMSYWNLMVKREISEVDPDFKQIEDTFQWKERDQGFFYMKFLTYKLQK